MNILQNVELLNTKDLKFITFPNDAITQHIKSGREWEPHFNIIINEFLNNGDYVIDCGANFGYNSVLMGKKIGNNGKLFCFEPQNVVYQQLNGNLILNNIFNAVTYKKAVSNVTNQEVEMNYVDFSLPWVNIGDTSVGRGGDIVKTIRLDDFNFTQLQFIKIDIQGYEYFALEGALETINHHKPDIFIEIEPHLIDQYGINKNQIFSLLISFGYEIYKIQNDYPCDYICTVKNKNKIKKISNTLNLIKI